MMPEFNLNHSLQAKANTCPVCNSEAISRMLKIKDVPVFCNVLLASKEQALQTPKGDIDLCFCARCGHVHNNAFDSNRLEYTENYENSLHYSPRFQEYAKSLAIRLIEKYQLHGKDVIDIGCGKGDFLKMLCDIGENRGIGFDPSYERDRNPDGTEDNFTIIQDFYSSNYSSYPADFIACRHVLEHIQFPRDFIDTIRHAVGSRENTVLYFEVPNVMYTLEELGIWDLIYEHCGYFSMVSLANLFNSCKFISRNIEVAFGGQYLGIEVFPNGKSNTPRESKGDFLNHLISCVEVFSQHYQQKLTEWNEKIEEFRNLRKKAVVWSAGSKGISFLNAVNDDDCIKYLVDINPHKSGMYIPGTGQKVVPPEYLKSYQPDVVIVMNEIYYDEIKQTLHELGLTPRLELA